MEKIKIFDFVELLHEFVKIQRTSPIKGRKDPENDAEHSYVLAMTAWYLDEKYELNLDKELIFSYALCHDLVELYAGDTDPHVHSKEHINSKKEREKDALEKIGSRLPEFESLHERISQYEKLADQESKFVYIIDKVLPVISFLIAHDTYYLDNKITFDKWEKWLEGKEAECNLDDPKIKNIIEKIKTFLRDTENFFYA